MIDESWFIDVRFVIEEKADRTWDLVINNKGGGFIAKIGPLSWDEVVRECYKCQRLRHDFIEQQKKFKKEGREND